MTLCRFFTVKASLGRVSEAFNVKEKQEVSVLLVLICRDQVITPAGVYWSHDCRFMSIISLILGK